MGGQGRDAEAGADLEGRTVRQRDGLAGRQHDGSWAVPSARRQAASQNHTRSPTRAASTPSPTASMTPAPSWFGTSSAKGRPAAARRAGLPVGRVHAGYVDPDPDLARPGFGHRPVDQGQDLWSTGHGVDDRSHDSIIAA